jgi:hypothetical protein
MKKKNRDKITAAEKREMLKRTHESKNKNNPR